jgi:hypothetical protein
MKRLLAIAVLMLAWCSTGLAASGQTLLVFPAIACYPETTSGVQIDQRNDHLVWDFDGATDEELLCPAVLPRNYSGGGLTVSLYIAFTSATSGTSRWQADIERVQASTQDIDSDGFTGTFQSASGSVPATSGHVIVVTITFTSGAQMDSLAVGEYFRLKIRRDADGTSGTDDVTTDAELLAIEVKET